MKKTFIALMAIAAIAAVSCQKENLKSEDAPEMVTITVTADMTQAQAELDGPDAKTVYNPETGTFNWSENEKLSIIQSAAGNPLAGSYEIRETNGFTNNNGKATFTFTAMSASGAYYAAVYPSSRCVKSNFNSVYYSGEYEVGMTLPETQYPTATSYDPTADLLYSDSKAISNSVSTIDFTFTRMAAIGKMKIMNLNSTENIKQIKISASVNVSGTRRLYYDPYSGRTIDESVSDFNFPAHSFNYASKSLILDYSNQSIPAEGLTAYFITWPFELAGRQMLNIEVTTSDNKTFIKPIMGGMQPLKFQQGRISSFIVNMDGIEGI